MIYKANNKLNSKDIFELRKLYFENAYPKGQTFESPIDLWNVIPNYGKVNQKNEPVFPKTSKLSVIDNQLLLDFVKDAAKDFLNACKSLVNSGKTCISTIIPSFTVKKGYIDFISEHQVIQNRYKNILFDYIKTNNLQHEILTINDFSAIFFKYYEDYSKVSSISALSNFYTKNSVYQTGLAFDISTHEHDNDLIKFQLFLNNPSFNDYTRIAGEYGFFVNQNAPWNLIANIQSKQMQKYMLKRGIKTTSSLFESHFSSLVYEYDFQSLINLVNSSYLEFENIFSLIEIKEKCSTKRFYLNRYQNSSETSVDNKELDHDGRIVAYLSLKLSDISKLNDLHKAKKQIMNSLRNMNIKEINQLIQTL